MTSTLHPIWQDPGFIAIMITLASTLVAVLNNTIATNRNRDQIQKTKDVVQATHDTAQETKENVTNGTLSKAIDQGIERYVSRMTNTAPTELAIAMHNQMHKEMEAKSNATTT